MKRLMITLVVLAIGACGSAQANQINVTWDSVGPGGGGGHYFPSISPADPNLMSFTCDMGGIYLSLDGAATWRMLPCSVLRRASAPMAFHPTDVNKMYVVCFKGLFASFDKGNTWQQVIGSTVDPYGAAYASEGIVFDPANPDLMYAVFSIYNSATTSVLMSSQDGGHTWSQVTSWASGNPTHVIYIDPTSPTNARVIYTYSGTSIRSSSNWGNTWTTLSSGLPGGTVTGFCAAWSGSSSAFYVTVSSRGVYKSTNKGVNWAVANTGLYKPTGSGVMQYSHPLVTSVNMNLVYILAAGVSSSPGQTMAVWKSTDAGANWACATYGPQSWSQCNYDPEWMTLYIDGGWFWGGGPDNIGCCATQPELAFIVNGGNGFITQNAGGRWSPMFTNKISDGFYRGRGAEVLTCYKVYLDPFDNTRRWISYTDIGLFTSKDSGSSWAFAASGSPTPNTCYELAIDPAVPGRVWGAWSNFHDLPGWKMLSQDVTTSPGCIAGSTNYGMNWTAVSTSQIPQNQGTATTIVLDPTSPVGSRTLYAGFLNLGVYKSTDGGVTWHAANTGLPNPPGRNVWRLVRHSDGTLFCAITANFPSGNLVTGGLYTSTDGAGHWTRIGADQPFDWIYGLNVDPRTSQTIYVSCFEVPAAGYQPYGTGVPWAPGNGHGGVWKTTNGGTTWTKIVNKQYCWDVSINPAKPDQIYACTFLDGVFRSNDGGQNFDVLSPPPFICTHRVTVEPGDENTIWMTTFGGGVWKGTIAQPPAITVTSPNGSEVWTIGSQATVAWTSTGSVGNVDIDLSTDDGAIWTTLVANTANDGSQAVTVPDGFSTQCKVRVKQTAGGTPSDISDAVFAITVAGDITLNGYIDGGDLNVLLANWNATNATWAMGDLTGNGIVDGGDLNVLLANWNAQAAPVAAGPLSADAAVNAVSGVISTSPRDMTTVSPSSTSIATVVKAVDQTTAATANTTLNAKATPTAFTAQVNFQPASVVAPQGYIVDSGLPFGAAANGYTYGWAKDLSAFAVQRNSADSPDVRYDTAIMLIVGGTWEMAVPSGMYNVKIVAGDGGSLSSQKFTVEGVPTTQIKAQTKTALWYEESVTVVVTDGRLTITASPGSNICFVQITEK